MIFPAFVSLTQTDKPLVCILPSISVYFAMLWEQSLIYLFITGVFLIQDDALRTSRHRGDFPTYQFTSNYTHPKTPWHSSSENGRGLIFIQKGSVNRILFPNKFHASFYNIKYLPLYCILLLNVTPPPLPLPYFSDFIYLSCILVTCITCIYTNTKQQQTNGTRFVNTSLYMYIIYLYML